MLLLIAMLQAVAEPATAATPPIHNYLKGAEARRCDRQDGEDIVVCAKDPERFRLKEQLPDAPLLIDDLGNALSFHIGPVTVGSIVKKDGTRAAGISVPF